MQGLHVVFAVDRAGLVGEDGETHHGVFDVGFLRQIPGMTVLCPGSCTELKDMLQWAVQGFNGPVAIRYPRGGDRGYSDSKWSPTGTVSQCGSLCKHRSGADVNLITYGTLLDNVMSAADRLATSGVEATVLRLQTILPIPVQKIAEEMAQNAPVVVIEETMHNCGIAASIAMQLKDFSVTGLDLGAEYITHGSVRELYSHCGLDAESIVNHVLEVLQREN